MPSKKADSIHKKKYSDRAINDETHPDEMEHSPELYRYHLATRSEVSNSAHGAICEYFKCARSDAHKRGEERCTFRKRIYYKDNESLKRDEPTIVKYYGHHNHDPPASSKKWSRMEGKEDSDNRSEGEKKVVTKKKQRGDDSSVTETVIASGKVQPMAFPQGTTYKKSIVPREEQIQNFVSPFGRINLISCMNGFDKTKFNDCMERQSYQTSQHSFVQTSIIGKRLEEEEKFNGVYEQQFIEQDQAENGMEEEQFFQQFIEEY